MRLLSCAPGLIENQARLSSASLEWSSNESAQQEEIKGAEKIPVGVPEDQYIKVGEISTRFWTLGDKGSTVILLHGFGDSLETWRFNMDAIADHHCVYAVDLVGYGRSEKPSVTYSGEYFVQFVTGFMEAVGIDRSTLIGNSMGGGVSLKFAVLFPNKVDKLVLEDSAGFGEEISIFLRLATLPILGELLIRPNRRLITQILKRCVYDPARVSDEWIERIYQMMVTPGARNSMLSTLRTSCNLAGPRKGALGAVLDNLSSITAPTLIVWGKQDRVLPTAHGRVGVRMIPSARLHVFDACGHVPHIERSDEFNDVVLSFLFE